MGLTFALKNQDRTEILKNFDAKALGITQAAFTIDSPPSGGVGASAAVTTATSCPSNPSDCVALGFDLMTAEGSSVPADYTTPGQVIAPFANFTQTVGTQRFDTSALDHLVFSVGSGSYNFCVHDFKFLDAQGNEVMDTQQQDGGARAVGSEDGGRTIRSDAGSDAGAIGAALDSGGVTSTGKYAGAYAELDANQ
jgi:hypothetical protein